MKSCFIQRARRSKEGFSLVELLVVIAIIGMLAAMVFPAIHRATGAAHNTLCRNNLRTLHYSSMTYVRDNDGLLPSPRWDSEHHLDHWIVAISEHLELLRRGGATQFPLSCQGALRAREGKGTQVTYSFNGRLLQDSRQIRLVSVRAPSRTAMIMDGRNAWEGRWTSPNPRYWWQSVSTGSNFGDRDFVHNERINVLHVEGNFVHAL